VRATLKAPQSKFRVVMVDTFDGQDWVHGDFDTLEQAKDAADTQGEHMLKAHVYDDRGRNLFSAGNF
jgi:hypothetical protein